MRDSGLFSTVMGAVVLIFLFSIIMQACEADNYQCVESEVILIPEGCVIRELKRPRFPKFLCSDELTPHTLVVFECADRIITRRINWLKNNKEKE